MAQTLENIETILSIQTGIIGAWYLVWIILKVLK